MASIGFNDVSLEQRQLITGFMGAGSFAARNETLFNDTLNWFRSGQSLDPEQGADFSTDSNSPRARFRQNIGRVINGDALTVNDMFVMAFIANNVYGADIDINRLDDEDYLAHIRGEFSFIAERMDAGESAPAIRSDFEVARLENAEAAQAAFEQAEPARAVQAYLNALGLREGSIDGQLTAEDATILRDNTIGWGDGQSPAARSFALSFTPEGVSPTTAMANLEGRMFADGGLNTQDNGALEALRHLADGRDFTPLIEDALTSGDPEKIMMAQAVVGVDVTGQWNTQTLDAVQGYLETPRGDGFPDTAYSAIAQTTPGLPPGMISTNATLQWLQEENIQLTNEQLETIYEGLSAAPLNEQHQAIAVWLSQDPERRHTLGSMINANHVVDPQLTALIETRREEVQARMEQEAAADTAVGAGAEATAEVADIPSMNVDTTGSETALLRAETARISGDMEGFSEEMRTYLQEATSELHEAEITFVRQNLGTFKTAGAWMEVQGHNPELATVLKSGNVEAIHAFISSHTEMELRDIFYDSNSNAGNIFIGQAEASGWANVMRARNDLAEVREELGIAAPETPAAPPPTQETPEPTPSPHPEGVTSPADDLISSVQEGVGPNADRVAGTVRSIDEMVEEACVMANAGAPATATGLGLDGAEATESFAQCAAGVRERHAAALTPAAPAPTNG